LVNGCRRQFAVFKIVVMTPQLANLLNHAVHNFEKGRLDRAEEILNEALKIQTKNFDALHILGVIKGIQNKHEEAKNLFKKALRINPNNGFIHFNLAKALSETGNDVESIRHHQKATQLIPAKAEVWQNYGKSLHKLGQQFEALINQGTSLNSLKRHKDDLISLKKQIIVSPSIAEAWSNQGETLDDLKRFELACYDQAITIKPDYADAYYNRGLVLQDLNRLSEALASYSQAITINPETTYCLGARLHVQMMLCDWSNYDFQIKELIEKSGSGSPFQASTPFVLVGIPSSPAQQQQCAEKYAREKYPSVPSAASKEPWPRHQKIRIAYFSADFHAHATSYLIAGLLEQHDRSKFELYAFSFGPITQDEMRQRVEKSVDHFIVANALSDDQVAQMARDLKIDIAIDLKGFTQNCRTGIFARRAAPIQVNYLGYPGTMGAEYMDYLIADRVVIPEEHQAYYTEKIVYLPHSYQVNDSLRAIDANTSSRREQGLPEQGFVFCCFNNSFKITPDVFEVWMRLLHNVKASVLWLLQDNPQAAANLQNEAQAHGIDSQRLIFASRAQLPAHLARHRLADLFLDTFHCNAHTTASDALWAGLPVLTRLGHSFSGRVAASLLTAIGIPELISETTAEYEAQAMDLAMYPEKLSALKAKLAQHRLTQPLFDTSLMRKHIENAYQQMYERHHQGQAPDHIYVAG